MKIDATDLYAHPLIERINALDLLALKAEQQAQTARNIGRTIDKLLAQKQTATGKP